jgi:Ca2+-binding RTX toxin-like protein
VQVTAEASPGSTGFDGSDSSVITGRYNVLATSTSNNSPDNMVGSALLDLMTGNAGNDTMDGGGGPDTMRGGADNDTYVVNDPGDVVDEEAAGSTGYDTVQSWISYALPHYVEALVLIGGASINGFGNELDNYLQGNGGNNWLDGSYGADLMKGFGGNDAYVVDNAGDVINEIDPGSGGWDAVYSYIDYKLGPNLEGLILLGTLKLDGSGNGLNNFIQGNGAANVIKASGGDDTVKGLGGHDKLDGGSGKDTADYSENHKPLAISLNGSNYVTVKVKGNAEDSVTRLPSRTRCSRRSALRSAPTSSTPRPARPKRTISRTISSTTRPPATSTTTRTAKAALRPCSSPSSTTTPASTTGTS